MTAPTDHPVADSVPPDSDLRFIRTLFLNGPNIWTYRPVLEVWVDIGELEDWPSNRIHGFNERLTSWLPSLIEHHCSIGARGGFLKRLHDGTWPAHILEHVTLELQALAGMPAGFGRAREMDTRGVYKVVVRAWHETVARRAIELARELVLAAMKNLPFDVAATVAELTDLAESTLLGPSTSSIVDAADNRNIPHIRLNEGNLVQLGYGRAQRRIWTAESDQTSAIAETISRDKALTKQLLSQCGIPVPQGILVHSASEAWEAACEIGLPVVVKPLSGNHGRAVFINLDHQSEIETAWQVASEEDEEVIVERHIHGQEHRLLVVGNRMVAAARGEIASISGDGIHSIRELIALQINTDPRRGETENHPLNLVGVDSACRLELERQGYTADDIPESGKKIVVQRIGNVAFDVTDLVHPETAAIVCLAARVVGLDIAGIDLVVEDISQPLAPQQGAIVEVNAGPGLLMHLKPAQGSPRPVGTAIIEHLFPQDSTGRIPLITVCGNNGRTEVTRLVAYLAQLQHKHVGLACRHGLFIDQRQIETGDRANWQGTHKLLLNPAITVAVTEQRAVELVHNGLAYDRCLVSVITGIDREFDFTPYAMHNDQKRFMIYRTFIDVVLPEGSAVLNADDPGLHDMISLCDGKVYLYSENAGLPILAEHLQNNGHVVTILDGQVVLRHTSLSIELMPASQLPVHAMDRPQILAAIAAAHALNLAPDVISAGLMAYSLNQG